MKKVTFTGKRPSASAPATADDWVQSREPQPRERTKRLTIDVPISLHRRVKSQCAIQNFVMADMIRDLLEERFPEPAGEAGGAGGVVNTMNRKHDDTTGADAAAPARG